MEIRTALQLACENAGWTPTKLAAECGVVEKTAKKWLSGEAAPRTEQFMVLRRLLPRFADLVDGKAVA